MAGSTATHGVRQRNCTTRSWVRPDAFLESRFLAHVYRGLVIRLYVNKVAPICVAFSASRAYWRVAQGYGETLR
jgi:hypothetical protein